MATVTRTIGPGGGPTYDYASLSAWEAGEQTDLVTAGDTHVAECYAFAGGLDDSVVINGWVTGASNRVHVKVADGEQHDGTPQTGFYIRTSRGFGYLIRILQDFVDLTDIDGENTSNSGSGYEIDADNAGILNRCIGKISSNTRYIFDFSKDGEIRNSLCYGQGRGFRAINFRTMTCLNCTAANLDRGFETGNNAAGAAILKNCVAYNCSTNYIENGGGWDASCTHNATSDASGTPEDDATSVYNVDVSDFADAANNDFHLSGPSSKLYEQAIDLSVDFLDDIDRDTRAAPWDIGIDEIVSGPPPAIEGTGTLEAQDAAVVGVGDVISPTVITGTGVLQAQDASVVGLGEVFGVIAGTGALQAQDATVVGVGDVASAAIGTGTLQAQEAQVSGVGAVVHAGSGALQAQPAAVVGVGEVGNVRTGTGALQAGEAAVIGTGVRVSVGSGALQAQEAAVTGAGVVEGLTSGTGVLQAQSAAVSGAGHLIRIGSGALQAQAAQVAGVGAILGELTLSPADIAAIADAVYAKLVSEGLVQQINEVWQRRGLDPANPQTYDKAGNEIRVGNITIDLSGDPSSVTQTRQP